MLGQGLKCRNVPLLTDEQIQTMKEQLESLSNILDGIQSYNTYGKLKAFKYSENDLTKAFAAYPHCDLIEKLKSRADKFEKLVGYLYTAQSYVVENEQPLYADITKAIERLGTVVASNKEADLKQYEALLISLVDRYVEYYLGYYTKCRLSAADARAKDRLMGSESKRICDIIKDSEFITATEYQNWITTITSLREADTSMTKAKVKEEPYHDFNPREYYGKPNFRIQELGDQLDAILKKWLNAMRSVFKDPSVQDNMDILNKVDRTLVEDFRTGKANLTVDNAAKLRDLITQLTRGIDKVEITLEDFRKQLNRPLTPNEAISILTEYINGLCAGKERNKVRIIIK
jgi:hypothetical protein